jgi:hypothetical protein
MSHDDDDDDDVLVPESEIWPFVAACLLMVRVSASPVDPAGRSLHEWAVDQLGENSLVWRAAIREVIAMDPDQRGTYVMAAHGDYDA